MPYVFPNGHASFKEDLTHDLFLKTTPKTQEENIFQDLGAAGLSIQPANKTAFAKLSSFAAVVDLINASLHVRLKTTINQNQTPRENRDKLLGHQ